MKPFEELVAEHAEGDTEWAASVTRLADRAWGRGDTIVFYQNADMGHPDLGVVQVTTWGSPAAQLEEQHFPEIPTTLPDIGGAINWRYQLIAAYGPETA